MTNPSFYFNDTSPQGFIVYETDIDSSQYSHEIRGEGVALPMPAILQVRKQCEDSLSVTKPQLEPRSADSKARHFLPSLLVSAGHPETSRGMHRPCNGTASWERRYNSDEWEGWGSGLGGELIVLPRSWTVLTCGPGPVQPWTVPTCHTHRSCPWCVKANQIWFRSRLFPKKTSS